NTRPHFDMQSDLPAARNNIHFLTQKFHAPGWKHLFSHMLFTIGNQRKRPHTFSVHKLFGKAISFLALLFLTLNASASDTIRAMSYNLLNYGASNNTISYKNPRLKAILDHVQPDILGVNELV